MTAQQQRALFLDRDGTLIEDKGYEYRVKTLKLYPDVIEGLKLLQKEYLFFIITNQPGIARGFYTVEQFHEFNNHLLSILKNEGIEITETCFCTHFKGCDCRKPSTRFVEDLVAKYSLNLADSWVIGDHPSDVEMGLNAGCRTAYLMTGHGEKHFQELKDRSVRPDLVAESFLTAAQRIIEH